MDLIAMSTHSRRVFESIADRILQGTNIPILLVRASGVSKTGLPTDR